MYSLQKSSSALCCFYLFVCYFFYKKIWAKYLSYQRSISLAVFALPRNLFKLRRRSVIVKPWSQDWLIAAGAYPGFCSMKQLEVFLLLLDRMLVHRKSLPR